MRVYHSVEAKYIHTLICKCNGWLIIFSRGVISVRSIAIKNRKEKERFSTYRNN